MLLKVLTDLSQNTQHDFRKNFVFAVERIAATKTDDPPQPPLTRCGAVQTDHTNAGQLCATHPLPGDR